MLIPKCNVLIFPCVVAVVVEVTFIHSASQNQQLTEALRSQHTNVSLVRLLSCTQVMMPQCGRETVP